MRVTASMTGKSPERIQKILADAGYASRRKVEEWLREGRIKVNGSVASLGDRITARAKVTLDGKLLKLSIKPENTVKIIGYNKPAGEVCSRSDEKGRANVFNNLPGLKQGRWINIGRLDITTTGLLLFTNDGVLANRLMHPSSEIEREYAVRILGEVTDKHLANLINGVKLDDGPAAFTNIIDKGNKGANHWFNVTLTEGRNREVRRLWESQGLVVSRLKRIRFGPCRLPRGVKPGSWWYLDKAEQARLLKMVGMRNDRGDKAVRSGSTGQKKRRKKIR